MSKLNLNSLKGLGITLNQVTVNAGTDLQIDGTLDLSANKSHLQLPTGNTASRPVNPAVGYMRWNTDSLVVELYDGTSWLNLQTKPLTGAGGGSRSGTSVATAAYGALEAVTGQPAPLPEERWINPDYGTPFKMYVANELSSLGTVPTGGPQWAYDIRGLNIISRSEMNQVDTMIISRDEYHRMVQRIYQTDDSPFIYWSIWDKATQALIGITRNQFTNGSFEKWRDHHTGDNPPALTANGGTMAARWWVWGTSALPSGNAYTITNDASSHVRSIPYRSNTAVYEGTYSSGSYGLHYKRLNNGEHYPWRNSGDTNTSEGYFWPSSSNVFYGYQGPGGQGIYHYIFVAEN